MLCSGQKGLFAREKVPKRGICKPGARRPGGVQEEPTAKVRARKPNSLAFTEGEREPEKPAGRVQEDPAAKVRARKPNSLAFRGSVRKPGDSADRVQEGPTDLGLRTKTEFIGLQGRRTQTGRLCRPGSGGSSRPWFAYENRIHWLTEEAYANREALPAEFRRVRPLKFALENRIHWLSRETSANRGACRADSGPDRREEVARRPHKKRKNFEVAGLTVNHFKVSVLPNSISLQIISYL